MPEKSFGRRTTRQRIWEIDVPIEPLLAIARSSKSSVVPTLQAFIGSAIRNRYGVGNKDIVAYTPVDLRPIFHFETGGNGASTFPIPYSEELDKHDLGKRAKALRAMLDVQVRPENLYQRVRSTRN